jgi:hypothetical protein
MDVLPSPKSQDHATTEPSPSVLVSVKSQVRSVQLDVKEATGASLGAAGLTLPVTVSESPSSSFTVRVTV